MVRPPVLPFGSGTGWHPCLRNHSNCSMMQNFGAGYHEWSQLHHAKPPATCRDAAPNFETSTTALAENGRTTEGLSRMKPWLTVRLPAAVKVALRRVDTDFRIESSRIGHSKQSWITPARMHAPHIADPNQAGSCAWGWTPAFGPVDGARLGIRLRALPAVAASASGIDLLQLAGGGSAVTRSPACKPGGPASTLGTTVAAAPPGGPGKSALGLNYSVTRSIDDVGCSLNLYKVPLNLTFNRVLEATVFGDSSDALLAIQLQDVGAFPASI